MVEILDNFDRHHGSTCRSGESKNVIRTVARRASTSKFSFRCRSRQLPGVNRRDLSVLGGRAAAHNSVPQQYPVSAAPTMRPGTCGDDQRHAHALPGSRMSGDSSGFSSRRGSSTADSHRRRSSCCPDNQPSVNTTTYYSLAQRVWTPPRWLVSVSREVRGATRRLFAMSRRCTCQAGVTTMHGDADWVLRHWTERIGGRRVDQRT